MTYGATDTGKGSFYRKVDRRKFDANYDKIWGKKMVGRPGAYDVLVGCGKGEQFSLSCECNCLNCMWATHMWSGRKEPVMNNTLYFLNPVLHGGENLTVRRGVKWAMQAQPGTVLSVASPPDPGTGGIAEIVATVRVTRIVVKRMCDITHNELHYEHDPKCHSRSGLLRAMRLAYPGFTSEEICTLVYFEKV